MSTTTHPNQTGWAWRRRWFTGQPHQIIGSPDNPYLLRWYVIPRNKRLNLYVHKFLRDDDDRALHDHPWWFVSVILRGGYIEHTESAEGRMVLLCRTSIFDVRSPWWRRSVGFRRATHRHMVALPHGLNSEGRADSTVPRVPAWTLIITGPNVRTWGFWCKRTVTYGETRSRRYETVEDRFIPWNEFGDAGCGEPA